MDGFDVACYSGSVNRYGKCNLNVLLPPTNGGAYYSKKVTEEKGIKELKELKELKDLLEKFK